MCATCMENCRSEVFAIPNIIKCFRVFKADCSQMLPRAPAFSCYNCINNDLHAIRTNLISNSFNDKIIESFFSKKVVAVPNSIYYNSTNRSVNSDADQNLFPKFIINPMMTPIEFWCDTECALLTTNHTLNFCPSLETCDLSEFLC